jgi:hypothetical protein
MTMGFVAQKNEATFGSAFFVAASPRIVSCRRPPTCEERPSGSPSHIGQFAGL